MDLQSLTALAPLLLSILGAAVGTIGAIGVVYNIYITRKGNIEQQKNYQELRLMKKGEYIRHRNFSNDKTLIEDALTYDGDPEVRIIGINSLGLVHQAGEDIKELLKKGIQVKILLLDPTSVEYLDRIKHFECMYKGALENEDSHKNRLNSEWNASMAILRCIRENVSDDQKKCLAIKVRREKPRFAFTAVLCDDPDNSKLYVNEYPIEGRGVRGIQYLVNNTVSAEKCAFKHYMAEFDHKWDKAIVIMDGKTDLDKKWIL